MKFEIADIVVSTAGRDMGCSYFVWGHEGNKILLVNGRSRKINNPKRKNEKHLVFKQKYIHVLDKIKNNEKINDSFLRKVLSAQENC